MKRGDIYRTPERIPERGGKAGYYVIVSRSFIARSPDVSTVVCAPIYSQVLGVSTEVMVGPDEGLPRTSAVRCDFLTLLFKKKLTHFVGTVPLARIPELDFALARALDLTTA